MNVMARNNVSVSGTGSPTLVFAHGLGFDQRAWRRLLPALSTTHRVVAFDHVGCGDSDRSAYEPGRYATLAGYASDVLEICAELELRGAVFVGHSVSSMIGALAAIAEPTRFARLVMIAPSPRYEDDPPDYTGGFARADVERLLELMDQNFAGWASALADVATEQPDLARELRDGLCSLDRRSVRGFARATFNADHRSALPHVLAPTLVIQSADDDIAPVAVGVYTACRLPRGELRVLAARGHLPHLTHASETAALIRAFLARAPRAPNVAP